MERYINQELLPEERAEDFRTKMRLKENTDLIEFIKTVKKCRRDVFFRTAEGDCLNLRSTLSQYLLSVMSGSGEFLQNGIIECQEASDFQILETYLQV